MPDNSSTRTPLIIDSDLRTITVPTDYVFGVHNDKDVLTVPFTMPRYYDNEDLSELDIRVNFVNRDRIASYYDVDDKEVGEDTIEFSWLLGAAVFTRSGEIAFAVSLRSVEEDGHISKEFNTTIATAKILEGLTVETLEDPNQYSILVMMQNTASEAEAARDAALAAQEASEMAVEDALQVKGDIELLLPSVFFHRQSTSVECSAYDWTSFSVEPNFSESETFLVITSVRFEGDASSFMNAATYYMNSSGNLYAVARNLSSSRDYSGTAYFDYLTTKSYT